MPSNKILLTDGGTVSCLAFARELGREGNEVHVGESFRHNITDELAHDNAYRQLLMWDDITADTGVTT